MWRPPSADMKRRWGLRHLYSYGKLAFFDLDGVRLFLSEENHGGEDSILYFQVDDIHGRLA